MYFVGEFGDTFLLGFIEASLINTIGVNSITKLTTSHVMKYKSFLAGIDYFTIVKSFELISKLSLISKLYKCI